MTAGQSAHYKKAFLEEFAKHGNVRKSAESVGLTRRMVYFWKEKDPQFLADFAVAEIEATESLEAEAHRRGVEGWDEPVYQQGARIGDIRRFSDTLLIFLLKGRAPQKYRDRYDVTTTGIPTAKAYADSDLGSL